MEREKIADYFASRILAEERSKFALLRRIPMSQRFRFISYYSSLDAHEQSLFRQAIGFRSAAWFGHPIDRSRDSDLLAPVSQYVDWCVAQAGDWRSEPYRDLRFLRHVLMEEPDHSLVAGLPPEARERIMTLETAKATELRKVARLAFAQLLNAKPENRGGGEWRYTGRLGDVPVCVELDFGSMHAQLRYQVSIPDSCEYLPAEGPSITSFNHTQSGDRRKFLVEKERIGP